LRFVISVPSYRYDVFISYSSADRPWAERLYRDLGAKQIKPFLDRESLRAGSRWEPQLLSALQDSRHLVALWSSATQESSWVASEVYRFAQIVDPGGVAGPSPNRQIFVVALEGENQALKAYQWITDLQEAHAYQAGIEQVDAELWRRVANKIEESIRSNEASIAVPLLIVTTTRDRLRTIDSTATPVSGPSLDSLLQDLGIGTKDDLLGHYDEARTGWRPFGSQADVQGVLEALQNEINQEIGEMLRLEDPGADPIRFRWDYLGDEFWTGEEEAVDRQTAKLRGGPAAIIVDPLSFYDELVRDRYANWILPSFRNGDAFVLVLTPFSLPANSTTLRKAIRQMARQVAEHFYRPPIFDPRYARSSAQIGDEIDLKGWLMMALAPHVIKWRRPKEAAVLWTRTGSAYP
jgi:TIR domain